MINCLSNKKTNDMFVESEHPRASNGEFGSGSGTSGKSSKSEYESIVESIGTSNAYQVKHDLAEAESIVASRGDLVEQHGLPTALSLVKGAKEKIKEYKRFLELHESKTAKDDLLDPKDKDVENLIEWRLMQEISKSNDSISMDSWAGDLNSAHNRSVYGTERSKREEDTNEYLHVDDCILTGEQVAPYLGKEIDRDGKLGLDKEKVYGVYRSADEVKKAKDSFNGIPLTDGHIYITPAQPHQNRVVGYTGTDATFKDNKLFNSVHVHVGRAINDIKRADDEKGGKKDLSCGYTYDLVPVQGNFNGEPYQFKMVNIKGNHLALVEDGRHPEAMIADSNFKGNTKTMSKKSWFQSILKGFASDDKTAIFDTAVELAHKDASEFAGGEVEQAQRIIEVIQAYDSDPSDEEKVEDKKAKDKKAKDEDEDDKKDAEDEGEEETEKKAKDKKAKDKKAKDEDDEDKEKAEDDEEEVEKEKAMDEAIRARNVIVSTAKKVVGMSDKFVESASLETIVDNALTKNGLNVKGRAFDSKVAMLEVLASTKEQAKPAKRVAADSVKTNSTKYPSLINRTK